MDPAPQPDSAPAPEGSPASASAPHQRRPRYKGTHPRKFEQKYKEHAPEQYPDEIAKIQAKGRTPAGMHVPICLKEILQILAPRPGKVGMDATLGYGGHAREILARLVAAEGGSARAETPTTSSVVTGTAAPSSEIPPASAPRRSGKLWATDLDPLEMPRTVERLRALGYGPECFEARQMNYAAIAGLAREAGRPFDFVLADLGVSSMQLDDPTRGFTYKSEGPLDLRLDPLHGTSAAQLLADLDQEELAELLTENADEPDAHAIAAAVVAAREAGCRFETTGELAEVVRGVPLVRRVPLVHTVPLNGPAGSGERTRTDGTPRELRGNDALKQQRKRLQRVFQALRIAVNQEFGALEQLLRDLPACVAPGGRVAILTFHSGEDRRVKLAFKEGLREGIWKQVSDGPLRPSAAEQFANPRSACAKLRWAVRMR
jgi:16S rRNA (cytosine1402-N4)-methyltransferase